MKLFSILILIGIYMPVLMAQYATPEVNACGGGYFSSIDASMSWTIGEISTETFSGGNVIFTQGFQQYTLPGGGTLLSGQVTYDNNAHTPLNGIKVYLQNLSGTILDSSYTSDGGYYLFSNVSPGTYTLSFSSDIPWGGVNASDALLTLKHFVQLIILQGLRLKAADVDLSSFVNSTDAFLINKRFVMIINSFPAPDWLFEQDTFLIEGINVTKNIKAICTGDVNGSYIPPSNCFINCGDTLVDDRDGQKYPTVQIGTQCWMKKNLNIGSMINVSQNQSNNFLIEKYCYDNNSGNCDVYGGFYQWDEMMQYITIPGIQGICPDGWHIPTDAEWCTLTTYLDPTVNCSTWGWSNTNAGGKMKEPGFTHWLSPNTGATNESGFTALGAGYRVDYGYFNALGVNAYFWSSSEFSPSDGIYRRLYYYGTYVSRGYDSETTGFSVRCVRTN